MLISLILGLVIGVILALTGAGGGILAVPLLVFGVGIGVAEAGPIGLLAVGLAASLGAVLGLRAGIVRYRAAALIAGAGMLVSPAGVWLARQVDNRWLSIVFAVVLFYVAFNTYRKARGATADSDAALRQSPPCIREHQGGRFIWTRPCVRALLLSGLVAGLL